MWGKKMSSYKSREIEKMLKKKGFTEKQKKSSQILFLWRSKQLRIDKNETQPRQYRIHRTNIVELDETITFR